MYRLSNAFWLYQHRVKNALRGKRFVYYREFVYNFQLFVYNFSKNLPLLKRILALPTQGQKCNVSVLQPFTFDNFQSEHPVCSRSKNIG